MGTVKYSGPVASFHCPTEATIRSLKVHFSPKQLGSGDPSPENVRPIVGWDGVSVEQRRKNLFDADNVIHTSTNCWVSSSGEHKITASGVDRTAYIPCLPNATYTISKSVGNVLGVGYTTVLPEAYGPTFSYYRDNSARVATVTTGADAKYLAIWYYDGSKTFDKTVTPEYIYRTLQVELGSTATPYEPYRGGTTNYTFGVLGKNKLNADAEQQAPDNTNMMPTNKRIFTPNTYCVGMSWSNYYTPNNVTSYSVSNDTITVTNGNVYGLGYPVRVAPGQAYHLSATTTNGRAHVAYFAADGTYISGVSTNVLNSSFTVPNDVETAVIIFYSNSGEATFSNIQLELGSTATTYEPYNPNHTVYGGWIDLITGEVQEEYKLLDKPWSEWGNKTTFEDGTELRYIKFEVPVKGNGTSNFKTSLCNVAKYAYANNNSKVHYYVVGNSYNCRVYLPIGTNEDLQIQVLAELITPITYHLAPTQLQTFLGQNNVWSNADYVEVEYDLHETQTILARKQFIVANQPHIVKPAAAPLQNFVTDLVAPLKECKVHFSPVQEGSGDPSPDNVRAISGWTGLDVYRTGKNLWNPDDAFNIINVYSNTATTGIRRGVYYKLPAGAYKLSATKVSGADAYIYANVINSDGTLSVFKYFIAASQVNIIMCNLTDGQYIAIYDAQATSSSTPTKFGNYNIQLEMSETATPYTSYTGTILPIDWTTEAGTVYGGYVDLVKGEVVEEWNIIDMGTPTWSYSTKNNVFISSVVSDMTDVGGRTDNWIFVCSGYASNNDNFSTMPDMSVSSSFQTRRRAIHCRDSRYIDPTVFREAVTGIKIVYPLKIPIVHPIDPITLKTLRGTNNIWSNANGNIELQYWKH